jgi:hypothetical protein
MFMFSNVYQITGREKRSWLVKVSQGVTNFEVKSSLKNLKCFEISNWNYAITTVFIDTKYQLGIGKMLRLYIVILE